MLQLNYILKNATNMRRAKAGNSATKYKLTRIENFKKDFNTDC